MQAEIAYPDDPLTKKLKEDLLDQGLFIDRRSFELLAQHCKEGLNIHVQINMDIAAGLRDQSTPTHSAASEVSKYTGKKTKHDNR